MVGFLLQAPPLVDGNLAAWAANYGFAAVIAVMFWRYITTTAKEQTETIRNLTATLQRVEKTLDRIEREHSDSD